MYLALCNSSFYSDSIVTIMVIEVTSWIEKSLSLFWTHDLLPLYQLVYYCIIIGIVIILVIFLIIYVHI